MKQKIYNYTSFDTSVYGLEPFATGSPRIGECATDFEAVSLDGARVRLSDFRGKNIVLETGSLTCPMFGKNIPGMNEIATEFGADDTVFLILYTREAHPGGKTPAHGSNADKFAAAAKAAELVSDKRIILVDDVHGTVHRNWGEFPNSLWLINPDGRVMFRSDWNNTDILRQVLSSSNVKSTLRTLSEHNMPDMSRPLGPMIWMLKKAGWKAVWDVVRQVGSMHARHTEVDDYYSGRQFAESGVKPRMCW